MKPFSLACRILLLVIAVALLLLVIGTMAQALPFFGSIGGYIVLGGAPLFAIGLCALLLAAGIMTVAQRKALLFVSTGILLVAFVLSCVCVNRVMTAFRQAGANVTIWHTVDTTGVRTDTQVYTMSAHGEVPLTVYYREDNATDKPVIVYVHGGGWIGGSMHDHTYYSRAYAQAGYVAFSLSYDLSTQQEHLATTTELQLTAAFAWIAQHAQDYGANPARLYLTGDSAGGNLALELAYKINGGVYTHYADVALPAVTAVAVTYPVADAALFWQNTDMVLGKASRNMCECYTGATPADDTAAYAAITPSNYVGANTPRTLFIVGEGDTMVPPEGTYRLAEQLTHAGIENRLVRLPYLNHGFDTITGSVGTQGVLSLTLQWFDQAAD